MSKYNIWGAPNGWESVNPFAKDIYVKDKVLYIKIPLTITDPEKGQDIARALLRRCKELEDKLGEEK